MKKIISTLLLFVSLLTVNGQIKIELNSNLVKGDTLFVNVAFRDSANCFVTIRTLYNKKVFENRYIFNKDDNEVKIPIKDFESGVYSLYIKSEDNEYTSSSKFVKIKRPA